MEGKSVSSYVEDSGQHQKEENGISRRKHVAHRPSVVVDRPSDAWAADTLSHDTSQTRTNRLHHRLPFGFGGVMPRCHRV